MNLIQNNGGSTNMTSTPNRDGRYGIVDILQPSVLNQHQTHSTNDSGIDMHDMTPPVSFNISYSSSSTTAQTTHQNYDKISDAHFNGMFLM